MKAHKQFEWALSHRAFDCVPVQLIRDYSSNIDRKETGHFHRHLLQRLRFDKPDPDNLCDVPDQLEIGQKVKLKLKLIIISTS